MARYMLRDFNHRPDFLELIGVDYDNPVDQEAGETLIICSARRTGSYELCRWLMAAGIGIPHEYFHRHVGERIGTRWGLDDPLGQLLPAFIQKLKKTRAQNGVFCFKLQPQQFRTYLMNEAGQELLSGAKFIHLYRPDVASQYKSFRRAQVTGKWDFSEVGAINPMPDSMEQALKDLNTLVLADAKFRKLFVQLDVDPLFVTTGELFGGPRDVIQKIAALIDVSMDGPSLDKMIGLSARYTHADTPELVGTNGEFLEQAFKEQ